MTLDLRTDFPILSHTAHGKPIVYLDSAATTQKPTAVLDAMSDLYHSHYANIHRGIYHLSEQATVLFEQARTRVQQFLNAKHAHEIIFTAGTTASINLVAQSFGGSVVGEGDEILLTEMEHHSNIVPWQMLAERAGARIVVIPVTDTGDLNISVCETLFTHKTRLLALSHVSNVMGTVNPVKPLIQMAHAHGVPVLLDGAQAVPHFAVDVADLDCDFYAFSAHKLYGPTGIGVLYGKTAYLEKMPPWQGGGGMISKVSFKGTTYAGLPQKFEAGTPAIAEAIGLQAAIEYVEKIGFNAISAHEAMLRQQTVAALSSLSGMRLLGDAPTQRVGAASFMLEGAHAHDVATILDRSGVCVRAGHHCAMPLMMRFGVPATVRVSFGMYNTLQDVTSLLSGLHEVMEIFAI